MISPPPPGNNPTYLFLASAPKLVKFIILSEISHSNPTANVPSTRYECVDVILVNVNIKTKYPPGKEQKNKLFSSLQRNAVIEYS